MILNSTYFKAQRPDFSALGITSCKASSANPRRALYSLTALQFWLQLFSIIFLADSVIGQWYAEFPHLNSDGHRFFKFTITYASIFFQISDLVLSAYASFYLRHAKALYENIQDVKIWIVVNNIYLLWTLTCLILSEKLFGSVIELCIRSTTICLFSCYKMYIVYQIYKNDKSAYIFLEQGSMMNDSSKWSSNGNQPPIPGMGREIILEVLREVEEQEKF